MRRRDRAAIAIERQGLRPTGRTGAAVGRHHQRREAGLAADVRGELLIEGDRVVVVTPGPGRGTGEELVGVRVAVDAARGRMRQAGEDRQVAAQQLERFEALGEGELLAGAVREPRPVLVGGIGRERHRHAIREVDAGEALLAGTAPDWPQRAGERLEPRQCESDPGSPQEPSAVERCDVHVHGTGLTSTGTRCWSRSW